MIEKILHGGNFAACFGAIAATAADLGICGGTATGISALLSAHAVIKKDKTLTPLAHQMGQEFEAAVKASPLPADTKKLIPQLMAKFPVSEEDIAKGILEPAQVAAIIRTRIEDARETEDTALTGAALVKAYEAILTQLLTPVLAAPVGMDPMQWAINRQILAQSAITGATKRLFEEGVTEKAIIGLAQKIAAETNDIGQAWTELQNAMEMAVRVQKEGATGSNHQGFVDEVLQRVAALSAEGEYAEASDAIDQALQQTEAEQMRLLDSGVEVALLDRNTEKAATLLIRKADIEAGGVAEFEALRALQDHHYEIGRDRGSNLESRLAIDLARQIHLRAKTSDERSTALNDLAVALTTLGERESNPTRLQDAVTAYKAALEERTRDKVPLDWAMTQNNLGTALRSLGEREGDPARLQDAVRAYEAALEEWTRDKVPLNWAMTQNNLGNALQSLGERQGDAARLQDAVTAYEAALEEWTRDKVPLGWATTQNNLGTALRSLGERQGDAARLQDAVTAYEAALEEWMRGNVPLNWAATQNNLANLYCAWFDLDGDAGHLDRAEAHIARAREVILKAGADGYLAIADRIVARIEARRAG